MSFKEQFRYSIIQPQERIIISNMKISIIILAAVRIMLTLGSWDDGSSRISLSVLKVSLVYLISNVVVLMFVE